MLSTVKVNYVTAAIVAEVKDPMIIVLSNEEATHVYAELKVVVKNPAAWHVEFALTVN